MSTDVAPQTVLEPIPQGMARGWSLLVNGDVIPNVSMIELRHPKYGALFYGKSPSGNFDQWSFHEAGGGGSVTVPFVLINGALYIGVANRVLFKIGSIRFSMSHGVFSILEKLTFKPQNGKVLRSSASQPSPSSFREIPPIPTRLSLKPGAKAKVFTFSVLNSAKMP